jgi:putative Mg2+ transporter-C (MgtC) family protein
MPETLRQLADVVPGLLTLADMAARLVAATLAGAVLGVNRNLRGKAAGLRTHALVALGAASVAAMAAHVGPADGGTRVIQGVITGVGFLGAGVILHPRAAVASPVVPVVAPAAPVSPAPPDVQGAAHDAPPHDAVPHDVAPRRVADVRGLTTAATVWVAAVLGLASGFGLWALTLMATLLTLLVLAVGGTVEDAVRRRVARRARTARRRRGGGPAPARP